MNNSTPSRKARGTFVEETELMKALESENAQDGIAAIMALSEEASAEWEALAPIEFRALQDATING